METKLKYSEEVITKEQAIYILENLNKGNRKLNDKHCEFLTSQMKKGLWKLNGECISFDEDGKLVNGQHRLRAVVKSECSILFSVLRGVERDAFKTMDSGRNRQTSDVFSIMNIPNYSNVSSIVRKYYKLHNGDNMDRGNVGEGETKASQEELLDIYSLNSYDYQNSHNFSQCLVNVHKIFSASNIAAYMCLLHIDLNYSWDDITEFFKVLFQYKSDYDTFACKSIRDQITNAALAGKKIKEDKKKDMLVVAFNDFFGSRKMKKVITKKSNKYEFKKKELK